MVLLGVLFCLLVVFIGIIVAQFNPHIDYTGEQWLLWYNATDKYGNKSRKYTELTNIQ